MTTKKTSVVVDADTSKYERAMRNVKLTSMKTSQSVSRSWSTAFGNINKVLGVFGIAGAAGFTLIAKQALESGDKIHKLNLRLGISTEALSQLQHVADLSGVTFETVTMGLQRMTRRVAEAAQGTGEARSALKELNIDAKELTRIAPDRQFERFSDALMLIPSQADRVRLAMKLFDSEGVALLQMMSDGSKGIREMREEADRLGLTLSQEGAQAIADANDSLTRIKHSMTGMSRSLVVELAPAITGVSNEMAEWIAQNRGLIGQNVEVAIDAITESTKDAATAMSTLYRWVHGLYPSWIRLMDRMGVTVSATGREIAGLPQTTVRGKLSPETRAALGGQGATLAGTPMPAGMSATEQYNKEMSERTYSEAEQIRNRWYMGEMDALIAQEQAKTDVRMDAERTRNQWLLMEMDAMIEAEQRKTEQSKRLISAETEYMAAAYTSMAGNVANTFAQIAQAGGKHSKDMFRMYQAFAIVEATMSAYLSIVKTLAEPLLPFPSNVIMSSVIGAMAFAQVASIAAAKPPSYDEGGVSRMPGYYYAGIPEAHIPLKAGSVPVTLTGGSAANHVTHEYHNYIYALDSQSFHEYTRRNPGAIVTPIVEEIQNNNSALRSALHTAIR